MKTILITGAGAPGIAGAIYAIRNNNLDILFKIVTVDINDDVVGKYLSDIFYKVPPPEDKDYINTLKDIVLKEKVDIILPQTTREISILAKNIEVFEELNIKVIVSSFDSIKIANDKFLLLELAKSIGVPVPKYFLVKSENELIKSSKILGYPNNKIVVKPRVSNGMRGLRIITETLWDVEKFLATKPEGVEINLEGLLNILRRGHFPELIVTEYLPGVEYTVDVFRGKNGTLSIPRLREKIRSGITFDALIDMREDIISYSNKLADNLKLKFCFGFQFKLSEEGIPKLLECNPRIQGTMVAGVFAGFNFIFNSILEALGEEVNIYNISINNNLKFKRYWGGIAIMNNKRVGKI